MSIFLHVTATMKSAATVQALITAAQLIQHIEPIGERMRAEAVFANDLDEMYSTPYFATRRDVLLRAQQIIIAQEQALDERRAGWIGVDLALDV